MVEKKSEILLSDATLRDGSHSIKHQITPEHVENFCKSIDQVGLNWVEVGHGNGLGASSYHFGKSHSIDHELLKVARRSLLRTKLSVHVMPGIATINRDLLPAIDLGVDVFRIGSHCSEADTTSKQIERLRDLGQKVYGVLMMSHAITPRELSLQAKIMEESGALGVFIMDSAGALRMSDVRERIRAIKSEITVPIGIHAHNNLGLAVANSLIAIEEGATMLDGCAAGFGAGAGNAQMEILISLLKEQMQTEADATSYLNATENALKQFIPGPQTLEPLSVATGLAGLFSGYLKPIIREASLNNIDAFKLIEELQKHNLVAGQEDQIIEIARRLGKRE